MYLLLFLYLSYLNFGVYWTNYAATGPNQFHSMIATTTAPITHILFAFNHSIMCLLNYSILILLVFILSYIEKPSIQLSIPGLVLYYKRKITLLSLRLQLKAKELVEQFVLPLHLPMNCFQVLL